MAGNNKTMNWIMAILLIIIIIMSGLGIYYSTTTASNLEKAQTELLEAIGDANTTSHLYDEAILQALAEIAGRLNITLPLTVVTSASPTLGKVNFTVSFNALAFGGKPPYTYEWNFGDGASASYERDPTHVYSIAGTYTATATVTDSQGEKALDTLTIRATSAEALTVFSLWGGSEEENFLEALDNFTELTGIEVNHFHYTTQELLIGVPMQLKSGSSIADVVIAPWPAWILDLAPYLTSVNDLINSTKYPENTINAVKDTNDVIWAAPFKLSGKPGFWYKKSFFENNSLTIPTTYDEFETLLATIQDITEIENAVASGNTDGWPLSDTTEAFIMGLGGYQLQEELETGPSARNWTDPEVRNVFGNLTELLAAGYFSAPAEWTSQITKFWDEKYGIYFMGSWMTTMDQIGNVSDLDFFGFPGTDGVAGSVDYLIVPKAAPNPNEAEQLVQWLAGADAQEIMVGLGGFFGTNIDVPDSAYKPLDKKVLDFISQPTIHIIPDLDDAIGGKFQTTFWDQLKLLWVDPTQSTLDDVLDTLQAAALEQQT